MDNKSLSQRMSESYEKNIESIKSGRPLINENPTPSQQEKGTVWIFNKVVRNKNSSKKFLSIDDIKNDPDYPELKKIFGGEVPNSWLESYLKQQEKIFKIYSSPEWDFFEYNGSRTFRDFIEDKVKSLGISKYADWSPADIWLVKDKQKVKDEIETHIGESSITSGQTISQLNDILRQMFKEKRVVGISLKKISGKYAIYEEVNVRVLNTDRLLKRSKKNYTVKKTDIKIKLDLSLKNNGNEIEMKTQDLTVKLGSKYKFQIKHLGGSYYKFDNLKFEGTPIGTSAARGGKSQTDKVVKLMSSNGLTFKNNHNDYPKTTESFAKNYKKYLIMFNKIKTSVEMNIKNENEFVNSFLEMFESSKKNIIIANSKLMQLDFISQVLSISPNSKYEEFWTDMFWLSIRKGNDFGPHGKLY
jgi:hypothetical protein